MNQEAFDKWLRETAASLGQEVLRLEAKTGLRAFLDSDGSLDTLIAVEDPRTGGSETFRFVHSDTIEETEDGDPISPENWEAAGFQDADDYRINSCMIAALEQADANGINPEAF